MAEIYEALIVMKCPSCKKTFSICEEKYDYDLNKDTICGQCEFSTSRSGFDFVEEIAVGDAVEYTGRDPKLQGLKGTIEGILKAGKHKFPNSTITTYNDMFYIVWEGCPKDQRYDLYGRETFKEI